MRTQSKLLTFFHLHIDTPTMQLLEITFINLVTIRLRKNNVNTIQDVHNTFLFASLTPNIFRLVMLRTLII